MFTTVDTATALGYAVLGGQLSCPLFIMDYPCLILYRAGPKYTSNQKIYCDPISVCR